MSKSVKRVRAALLDAGLRDTIVEMPSSTRTAADAASACGCELDQIVKSLIFTTQDGRFHLLLVPGGAQAAPGMAATLIGEPIGRADPAEIRTRTGFAIGGVAPIGHLCEVTALMDPRFFDFDTVWAAAGTPRHVFSIAPDALRALTQARVEAITA
ncbi:MAG: YbaK/EbsC family protein [Rubricella sp.]